MKKGEMMDAGSKNKYKNKIKKRNSDVEAEHNKTKAFKQKKQHLDEETWQDEINDYLEKTHKFH